jgi:hypothetical protein
MSIAATALSDFEPCPRVELVVNMTGVTFSVSRSDGEQTLWVRGWRTRPATSPLLIVDYEAPLDVDITYTVTAYSSTGASLGSESVTVSVPSNLDADRLAILQDPYDPSTAMPVQLEGSAVTSLTYSRELAIMRPASGQAIAFGTALGDARDVPLSALTRDGDEGARFLAAHRNATPVLLRTVAPIELPRVCYLAVGEIGRRPIDLDGPGWTLWSLSGSVVRGPSASYSIPVHTWDEVEASYATWDDLLANKATWLDVERNPLPGA